MDVDIWVDHGELRTAEGSVHEEVDLEFGPGWYESSRMLRLGLSVSEWMAVWSDEDDPGPC